MIKDPLNPRNFMQLRSGSNVVRIVTSPFVYRGHQVEGEVVRCDKGWGDTCKLSHEPMHCDGHDPLIEKNYKGPQNRYIVGAIDRRDGNAKILDLFGPMFTGIQQLSRHEHWGDPKGYDINIVVDVHAGYHAMYTIIPQPLCEMSGEDKRKASDFFDVHAPDMQEFCKPRHTGKEHSWHPLHKSAKKKIVESRKPKIRDNGEFIFPADFDPKCACQGCEDLKKEVSNLKMELKESERMLRAMRKANRYLKTKINNTPSMGTKVPYEHCEECATTKKYSTAIPPDDRGEVTFPGVKKLKDDIIKNIITNPGVPKGEIIVIKGRPAGIEPCSFDWKKALQSWDDDKNKMSAKTKSLIDPVTGRLKRFTKDEIEKAFNRSDSDLANKKIDIVVDGKVIGTINDDKKEEVKAKSGAKCVKCNKDYPYAEPSENFECWECKNGF